MRYHGNKWQKLQTKMTHEDNTYIHYEATTPGLSIFAITTATEKTTITLPLTVYIVLIAAALTTIIAISLLYYKKRI